MTHFSKGSESAEGVTVGFPLVPSIIRGSPQSGKHRAGPLSNLVARQTCSQSKLTFSWVTYPIALYPALAKVLSMPTLNWVICEQIRQNPALRKSSGANYECIAGHVVEVSALDCRVDSALWPVTQSRTPSCVLFPHWTSPPKC